MEAEETENLSEADESAEEPESEEAGEAEETENTSEADEPAEEPEFEEAEETDNTSEAAETAADEAEEDVSEEASFSEDKLNDLVSGLTESFAEKTDGEPEEISAAALSELADVLTESDEVSAPDATETKEQMEETEPIEPIEQIEQIEQKISGELDALTDVIRIENAEAAYFDVEEAAVNSDLMDHDDTILYTRTPAADLTEKMTADTMEFSFDDAAAEPEEALPQQTMVFTPVRPQPTSGETAGSHYRADSYDYKGELPEKPGKHYGAFKGLAQIAGLLLLVAGIAWLLSAVAFSALAEEKLPPAEAYDYSTNSTVIRPFIDDSDEDPIPVPEFTGEKLTVGDSGEQVLAVQRTLASLGYLSSNKVSGTFDPATRSAVRQFQKVNLLEETGVVDEETYNRIFDANSQAPTTKTTDLPTSTETETSATEPSETGSSASDSQTDPTGESTEAASSEESEPVLNPTSGEDTSATTEALTAPGSSEDVTTAAKPDRQTSSTEVSESREASEASEVLSATEGDASEVVG